MNHQLRIHEALSTVHIILPAECTINQSNSMYLLSIFLARWDFVVNISHSYEVMYELQIDA